MDVWELAADAAEVPDDRREEIVAKVREVKRDEVIEVIAEAMHHAAVVGVSAVSER